LRSMDKIIVPFSLEGNDIYFLSNEGIECVDIDITEIKFKKAVISGEDISSLIEGGELPGLAPLSYLVKEKKGAIALPYIKDNKQRFELCLSDSRLNECMEYCMKEGNIEMNRRLADAAVRGCEIEIAEKCFKNIKEWNMLFMLYVCSKREDKMMDIINLVDEVTRSNIMLYLENMEYFMDTGIIGNIKDENKKNDFNIEKEMKLLNIQKDKNRIKEENMKSKNDKFQNEDLVIKEEKKKEIEKIPQFEESNENFSDLSQECNITCSTVTNFEFYDDENNFEELSMEISDSIEDQMKNEKEKEELCWESNEEEMELSNDDKRFKSENYPINNEVLNEYIELRKDKSINDNINKGLLLTTEGKFSKAIQMFRNGIINIGFEIKNGKGYEFCKEERKKIGAYISGLSVEKARRKTELPLENIMMAKYFASLPLEKEHSILSSSTAIMVFRKYGNFKQAKELANLFKDENENVKIIDKALSEIDPNDSYILPEGIFCCDVLDIKTESKNCLMCFINSFEGDVCTNCKIGILQ